jgi:hypothetical protein
MSEEQQTPEEVLAGRTVSRASLAGALGMAFSSQARAEIAAGRSPIAVTRTRIVGPGVHICIDPRHAHDDRDALGRTNGMFGNLGAGLLRGAHITRHHQLERLASLKRRHDEVVARFDLPDNDPDRLPARLAGPLLMWDTVGLLLQVSEHLAVLVKTIERTKDWTRFGEELVRAGEQPFKVMNNAPFVTRNWWIETLGLTAELPAQLSQDSVDLLRALRRECRALVMEDVETLRVLWTRELHRVATRHKHAYSYVLPRDGTAWLAADDTLESLAERVERGSLFVIDQGQDGDLYQLELPLTGPAMEALFLGSRAAIDLGYLLKMALSTRAEYGHPFTLAHPRSLVAKEDPRVPQMQAELHA